MPCGVQLPMVLNGMKKKFFDNLVCQRKIDVNLVVSIIDNYKVVFGDILEISEYFYSVRKKWDDCKHRILSNQFSSYRERLALIK